MVRRRLFATAVFAIFGLIGILPDARAESRCVPGGPCAVLFGPSIDGRPALAALLGDVMEVFEAPENAWVKSEDRPPPAVTAEMAAFLKKCFQRAMSLKRYLLPPCLAEAAPVEPEMVDRSIPWTNEREALMRKYLEVHTGDPSTELRQPTTIVTHWTATSDAESVLRTFRAPALQGRDTISKGGRANVGCHYLIDQDGTIYQTQTETKIARHTVGLNRTSLCIENVGGPKLPLTAKQLAANARLIQYLVTSHPTIDTLIGHSEHKDFDGTYVFSELDDTYRSDRVDEPGKGFLKSLRHSLAEPVACPSKGTPKK